jgi:hypothetical protein
MAIKLVAIEALLVKLEHEVDVVLIVWFVALLNVTVVVVTGHVRRFVRLVTLTTTKMMKISKK